MDEMTDEELRTTYQSAAVTGVNVIRYYMEGADFRDGLRAVAREVARRAWGEFREAIEAIEISPPADLSDVRLVGFAAGVHEFSNKAREVLADLPTSKQSR